MADAPAGGGGGTVSIGGKPVKKTTLYIAGALGVGVIGFAIYEKRKNAAAAAAPATGLVTDPAGNQCSALDPNSGYCPGTAADVAYQQSGQSGLAGLSGGSSVGGGYAYPVTPGQGISTPGSVVPTFTDNASWAQYVEAYMVQNLGGDANTIGNALGKYITGQQVTSDQQAIIEQAIAYGNYPPVQGTGGFPPSIRLSAGTPAPTGTVAVPAVIGKTTAAAVSAITAAGLVAGAHATVAGTVNGQTPKAGTKVTAGSTVDLSVTPSAGTGTIAVPNVVGTGFGAAYNTVKRAGLKPSPAAGTVNSNYKVTSTQPAAGAKVKPGSTVHLTTAPAKIGGGNPPRGPGEPED